jgi:hypothetical protein
VGEIVEHTVGHALGQMIVIARVCKNFEQAVLGQCEGKRWGIFGKCVCYFYRC